MMICSAAACTSGTCFLTAPFERILPGCCGEFTGQQGPQEKCLRQMHEQSSSSENKCATVRHGSSREELKGIGRML